MDKIRLGYIFRIDDITPEMNRENFRKIEKIFDTYGIKPIIGVVPDNKDNKLNGYGKIDNFREKIKELKNKGWIIAQHGYQHIYTTKNSGIIGMNNYSEFAGLSYNQQFDKIKRGKELLEKNLGMKIKRRMAPAHSFDKNTCKVLKKIGFKYITDGIALYPFEKYGLKWLPQQIRQPEKKIQGIRTICLHINKYDKNFINNIEGFIKKNKHLMLLYPEKLSYKKDLSKKALNIFFNILFWSKIYIYKTYFMCRKILKFIINKSIELKDFGGFFTFSKGCLKYIYNLYLQKKYKFDKWNLLPIQRRPYGLFIIKYLNKHLKGGDLVIEVGCGLGEIGKGLKKGKYIGFDTSKEVINAANTISNSIFYIGSFDNVKDYKINYLITVNFMHNISKNELIQYYKQITEKNKIEYIILDEIKHNNNYQNNHNFYEILPKEFQEITREKSFEGGREIVIFKNKKYN